MFRSKRNALVRRLWKQRVSSVCAPTGAAGDETHGSGENSNAEDLNIKSVAQSMLKRLKESQLEMLLRAVDSRGADETGCVLIPRGDLRLGRRTAAPNVLCCQLWRWSDLKHTYELKRLHWCETINDPLYICCNPYHWSRLQSPESPPPPYSRFPGDSNQFEEFDQTPSNPVSTETGHTNQYGSLCSYNTAGSSLSNSGPPWCTMAYWELRTRVGRLFPVQKTSVNVFVDLPHGDGLCLGTLIQYQETKTESIVRTREKIGLGVTLTREDGGAVWLYNRSKSVIFANSPTLDSPGTRTLTVYKIQPGNSIKIFDFEKARYYRRLGNTTQVEAPGPFDPNSVRISFAKGWGPKYSRQFVTSCPCWLEIFLTEPSLPR